MNKNSFLKFFFAVLFVSLVFSSVSRACTNVLVSRGASADGSVMTSWTYDVGGFAQPLHYYPGGEHAEECRRANGVRDRPHPSIVGLAHVDLSPWWRAPSLASSNA